MRPTPKFPYLEHDGVLAFAHRGGNLQAPENTMAAFSDAARQGYRFLKQMFTHRAMVWSTRFTMTHYCE